MKQFAKPANLVPTAGGAVPWAAATLVVLLALACNPIAFFAGEESPTRAALDRGPVPTPTTVHGEIGARIPGDGLTLTAAQVELSTGLDEVTPDADQVLVLIRVSVENTSPADPLQVSPGDFQLKASDGSEVNFTPLDDAHQLQDAELAPGTAHEGTLAFLVEQNKHGWHLMYDFNEQHLDIDLGL